MTFIIHILFTSQLSNGHLTKLKMTKHLSEHTCITKASYFTLLLSLHMSLHNVTATRILATSTTDFDFGTLSLSSLRLLGDAHLNNGSVRLTRDLQVPTSAAGRALYSEPIRFRQQETNFPASFSTFFTFSIKTLNPSSIGGGLAFVISPDEKTLGSGGGFLGLLDGEGGGSTTVGVEFDTMMDVPFEDVNGNHVGLDLNSMVSSHVGDLDDVEIDLKSGNLVNCWVEYDGVNGVLSVSVSYSSIKPDKPFLSVNLNLGLYVNDFMFVGFSGSTQGSTEIHSIEWWSFSSSFNSLPHSTNSSVNFSNPQPPSMAPSSSDSVSRSSKSSSCHNQLCEKNPGAVAGVVTAGAFFLAILGGGLFWVYTKKVKNVKKSESFASSMIKLPREFSYRELKSATKCFRTDRVVGNGAFGTVYKGILPETGDIVAVKRCSHSTQGKNEFMSELSIIGTLSHRNLIRLQGWCHEKGEILLVYDLMPNGSLDKVLFESRLPLPWSHRLKILLGVASALAYLHQECDHRVIHRDVKTSNIMLDEGFNAKLGDFGLARQTEHDKSPDATVAAGTMGYLAPEYLVTGRATEKTDVYSYGVVVLEVATGRRAIENEADGVPRNVGRNSNLVDWVWSLHKEGKLLTTADPRLGVEYDEAGIRRVLLVGLACCHPDSLARPTMRGVVQMLAGEAPVPAVPRSKPSMNYSTSYLLTTLQDSISDCNGLVAISTSSSEGSFMLTK